MVIALPVFLERMSVLVPAERRQVSPNAFPGQQPFKILYRLSWDRLFADFHENLDLTYLWSYISSLSTNVSQQVSILYIIVSVTGNDLI